MRSLQTNSESGFLEANNQNYHNFDSKKKLKVIEFVKECASQGKWPHISTILKQFNVSNGCFYQHLKEDPCFREKFEDARSPLEDHIVSSMVENASKPQGTTDRIFLLKNLWKERWNENYLQVNVEVGGLKGLYSHAIEAEIVDKKE